MAGEQGYLYEQRCNRILNKIGVLPGKVSDYGGNNTSSPDGEFKYNGSHYKVEYKLDMRVDLGQASLAYDLKKKKWYITGRSTPEGLEIQDMLRAAGAEKLINSDAGWKSLGVPNKILSEDGRVTKKQAAQDYKNFKDKFLVVPPHYTNDYYAAKGNYYIQVGGLGFYHMQKDPAGIGAPQFLPNLRVRFRIKGDAISSDTYYNYRFTVALQAASRPTRSPFDLEKDPSFLIPGETKIRVK